MRSLGLAHVVGLVGLVLAPGCVEGFRGSNIQVDLSPGTPVQAPLGRAPQPGEIAEASHFRLFGIQSFDGDQALFELQRFEIHKIVDLTSPCFIDVGDNVRFPGIHVSQFGVAVAEDTGITDLANPPADATEAQRIDAATAVKRMENLALLAGPMGIKVVTSASETRYPAVDADCTGSGLPPPECRDEASNARRLAICQATWAADPALFEGTDRILTSPLSGTTLGFVVGLNPISPAPVGGAQFFVDAALDTIDDYAIHFFADGADTGTLLYAGSAGGVTRGVTHVHMESPLSPQLTAELAIFENLSEDDVSF